MPLFTSSIFLFRYVNLFKCLFGFIITNVCSAFFTSNWVEGITNMLMCVLASWLWWVSRSHGICGLNFKENYCEIFVDRLTKIARNFQIVHFINIMV